MSFPEMAVMKKPKRLNINFNFSDDSDDDKDSDSSNVQTKRILKELKTESNHTENTKYLHSTYDKTIISSDHLNMSELPSLCEDFGLPVTESTCLDGCDSDPTLYLTALGDDLNQSKPHHITAAEIKYCHISRDPTRHKLHTSKQNFAEDKENLHLINNKKEMIPSGLSHKPATDHQDNYLGRSNIRETPQKGNKTSIQHRLYGNDEFFTPSRVECNEERINNILVFQNELSAEPDATSSDSTCEQSLYKHHKLLTDSFVEVQDISVQTSFTNDDIIPESKENHVCELQNNMPDCDDADKSGPSLFDSPNQAAYSKESEESFGLSDSSDVTDGNQDDVLASSYEVQDISVQTSFVESLIPDSKSSPKDTEHSSIAHECIEQYLHNIEKSFMEMNIQNNQEAFSCIKTLSDEDKGHSRCSDRKSTSKKIDVSIKNGHKTEFESLRENCSISTCTVVRDIRMNKDNTTYPENIAVSDTNFGTYRDRHSDRIAEQTKAFLNCADGQRNTYRGFSSNSFDGEESIDVLAAESEIEGNQDSRETDCTSDQIDENEVDDVNHEKNDKQSHCPQVNNTKLVTTSGELNIKAMGYGCEIRSVAGVPGAAGKTDEKTQAHVKNKQGLNGNTAVKIKILTEEAIVANVDRSRQQAPESSDDDSDFENFLNKVKSSSKPKTSSVQQEMPMSEFIIDDNEDDDDSSKAEGEDDDEVFYIKTNNELNDVNNKRRLPPRFQERVYTYYSSDDNSSDIDDSDSDLDDFIVDAHPKKKNTKIKSSAFHLSSSDESLLDTKPTTESKAKTASKWQGQNKKCNDGEEELDEEQNKVSRMPEKGTHLSSRTISQGGSFEDDCLNREHEKEPFKIPKCIEQWKRPFETPARLHTGKDDFKTPRNVKGLDVHPMTAPRPAFSGDGVNDNAFFLKSLNADMADYKRHADAVRFIKRFKETKAELTQKIFKIFNNTVFEDKLSKDFQMEWNSRYTKTAGTFHYKGTRTSFVTKIVLSVKICDSPERVRDTLAHELCHAAVKLINGISESHGVFWKSWARKVNRTFPFMPVIARCHSYDIATKYTYQCDNCKYRIGRHSKSLDTDKKVCGHCHGKFQLYLTRELNSSSSSCQMPVTPVTPRTPNKFAMFVKECYSEVKKRDDGLRHSDVMKILSQKFAEKNKICD